MMQRELYDRFYPGLTGILLMLLMLALRQPWVWLALALCGLVGNSILNSVSMNSTSTFDVASGYPLSVIPLFVLMGEIASSSRMSRELFQAARITVWIERRACYGVHCRFRRIWSYQRLLGSDRRKHDT